VAGSKRPQQSRGGLPDELRTAIERTFAAVAGSAAETRERAGELLDEAVRRGIEAREAAVRRGTEARKAVRRRGQQMSDEAVKRSQQELEALRKRVAELEQSLKPKPKRKG
jgi:polyhydroxyalkanoate synthesis regulator phasin